MRNLIKSSSLSSFCVVLLPLVALAFVDLALAQSSAGSARLDRPAARTLLAKAPPKKAKGKGKKGSDADTTDTPPAPALSPADAAPPVPANLPPPPALPDKYRAVAVLPAQGQDVPEDVVRGLEQSLLSEVDETEGMRAVSPLDIKNDLATVGIDPALCQGQVACVARAGRYARAHLALDAKIAAIGGTLSVSLRLVDTDKAVEVGRVADPVSEDVKERAQELHRMAVQVLAPQTYVGSLTVQVATEGAEVYVDDKLVGTTPLKGPLDGQRAGPHILRVTKPGFADVNQFVDVVYKRNATVSIDLANNTIGGLIVEVESKTGFGEMWVAANAPGVEIRVDGEPKGVTPLSGSIVKVAAGKRRVSFRGEKMEPQVQEIEIKAQSRVDIAITVEGDKIVIAKRVDSAPGSATPSYDDMIGAGRAAAPAVAATVTPAPWAPGSKFYAGVVAGGVAVLGLGVGSIFANTVRVTKNQAQALSNEYDQKHADPSQAARVAEICSASNANGTCKKGLLADKDSTGQKAQTLEFVSLGAGVLFAAAGVGLVLWDMKSATEAPTPQTNVTTVGLAMTPLWGGAAVSLHGQF